MSSEEILALAEEILKPWAAVTEISRPRPDRLNVTVKAADQLLPIVVGLRVKRLGYLSAIVGMDLGPEKNEIEVLYYFCPESAIISLRLRVPRESASLPTLSDVIPSAEVFERELREMFGIEVAG